jgi:peptidoglycan/xylan/chitin deacetylase (PgdA/CDA1 family)
MGLSAAEGDDLVRISIRRAAIEHLAWAEGESVTVPRQLLVVLGWLDRIEPDGSLSLPAQLPAVPAGASLRLRDRAAFTNAPPVSARLPVSYQRVPGWLRAAVAAGLGRWRRRSVHVWSRFPAFPLDLSADFVADLERGKPLAAGRPAPVVLSHDIDSPEGLRNLVDVFLPLEEEAGSRSVSFIVPCAWPIDHGLVAEVRARGHQIGVHGYDHSNRSPFADEHERRHRLDAARPFIDRYDARGYRAPSLLRTRALLRDLSSRYAYDSSIPTSGGLFPVPNNGCATARPFTIEGVTEVPVSMPRDGSLRFLGYSPAEIAAVWRDCASRIARARGVVMLLTHCERRFSGTPGMLDAYRRTLAFLATSSDFRFCAALDVAASSRDAA